MHTTWYIWDMCIMIIILKVVVYPMLHCYSYKGMCNTIFWQQKWLMLMICGYKNIIIIIITTL